MSKGRDPIKRVELADGRVRYRFTVDVGRKPNGKRDQRTFTLDSLREARAERARIVSESARGAYVRPSKVTVRQAVAEFLASRQRRRGMPGTVQRHRRQASRAHHRVEAFGIPGRAPLALDEEGATDDAYGTPARPDPAPTSARMDRPRRS